MEYFYILFAGFLLDLVFGDPSWLPHPIIFIGKVISKFQTKLLVLSDDALVKRKAGFTLVVLVLGVTLLVFGGGIFLLDWLFPPACFVLKILLTYQILATKCLAIEGKKVHKALISGTIIEARTAVGYLVGRDTGELSNEGVTKATVETIAENTVDGIVAPLFYMAIGGPVLGIFYKAINTMDSMVGYKNEKYLDFGRCAAKLDDVANYIPARISAVFMIIVSFILKMDSKSAYKVWKRDRRKHASPNSAQTESVCAGALGVQLAGSAIYFGKVYEKPFIGDKTRNIEAHDILNACKLMYGTAWLAMAVFGLIQIIF
ncbi:MAG: adenosylcobinamide-phosphate synthase CbiB [Eubacteriales bacterium]